MYSFDLWPILSLTIFIALNDYPLDEGELLERLRSKALPTYKLEQDRLQGIAGSFEWSYSSELNDGRGSPIRRSHMKYSGSRTLGCFLARDYPENDGETYILNNPRYEATIEKSKELDRFVLQGGKWKPPNSKLQESYLESEFDQLLMGAYPKSLELDSFLNHPKQFRIVRVEAFGNDVELEVDDLLPPSPRMKTLKVIVRLRETEDWRCLYQEYRTTFERKSTIITVTPTVENHPEHGMITRSVEVVERDNSNPGFEKRDVFRLLSIDKQPAAASDFFLPKYSIFESALIGFDGKEPFPQ